MKPVPAVHYLKTWPQFYREVDKGDKCFEVRKNDRDFKNGDLLCLQEWNPATKDYTGKWVMVVVTYLTTDPTLVLPGHAIMSISRTVLKP